MRYEAVIFDVGGPIDTEVVSEQLIDADLRSVLSDEGASVSDDAFDAANRWAVYSFAPNAYQSIIWNLCRSDYNTCRRVWTEVERRAPERDRLRGGIELRPGVATLVSELASSGLRLGLAANQPGRALADLDRLGIGQSFAYRQVSGTNQLRKPDVRVFLAACDALEVDPSACIMVGDRVDIDVAPAKLLGMTVVRMRTGRHASQEPRSWTELPDAEVSDINGLAAVLRTFIG